jgi:hypothetical protein
MEKQIDRALCAKFQIFYKGGAFSSIKKSEKLISCDLCELPLTGYYLEVAITNPQMIVNVCTGECGEEIVGKEAIEVLLVKIFETGLDVAISDPTVINMSDPEEVRGAKYWARRRKIVPSIVDSILSQFGRNNYISTKQSRVLKQFIKDSEG